jgi:hypothetical protein
MSHKKKLKIVFESFKPQKKFLTLEGEEIQFGSLDHVGTFDNVILELVNIRRQVPKEDGRRKDRISQCLESLRYLRSKAYRSGKRSGLITED